MPQHPRLFNRTMWDNIRYGNPTLTPADVERALAANGLPVADLMARLHRPVGKQGDRLSGGQRQLVWILRAHISKSDVLVLDEPTASLDGRTREHVLRLIESFMGARTVIVITHDPALFRLVDRVVGLKDGRVHQDQPLRA